MTPVRVEQGVERLSSRSYHESEQCHAGEDYDSVIGRTFERSLVSTAPLKEVR